MAALALPGSIVMRFLDQHAATLKHLNLQHTKPSASQSPANLSLLPLPVLPHLETLIIQNGWDDQEAASKEGLDAALGYIHHSWDTLTTLVMDHCAFNLHDLGTLLDLLWRRNADGGGGLKRLFVSIQVLNPQVLDILAEKLPQLEILQVNFKDLRSNDGVEAGTVLRHLMPQVRLPPFVGPLV
ncbi:hypothetical protein M413DRAFT_255193 [Hebeloma cylindrosporum]|uniref:F-box domain-containing protein n=1 Tax=Hebeloma cylindrosporum TaxID=76867 RepID=A0A0C2Y9Q9_HEBCY|nr:hypothetical protein M413DRAFT_255193 [Hebeloma cylindrosporum h7]